MARFKLCIGTDEHDPSSLFFVDQQKDDLYYIQGSEDDLWIGNFYSERHYDVEGYGADYVSGDDPDMALHAFTIWIITRRSTNTPISACTWCLPRGYEHRAPVGDDRRVHLFRDYTFTCRPCRTASPRRSRWTAAARSRFGPASTSPRLPRTA